MNNALHYAVAIAIAFFLVYLLSPADAHTPCDAPARICGYQQAVNPVTGDVEQQYVCD